VRFLRRVAEEAGRNSDEIEVMLFAPLCRVVETAADAERVIRGAAAMFKLDEATLRAHPMVLVGQPEQIVTALEERRERWGIRSCMISSPTPELCETFGKEILPRLAS